MSNIRRLQSSRAFTLIELLIVILVIGILIAVAAPSFLGQTDKAHDSAAKQYLAVAYRNARATATDYAGDYPSLTQLQSALADSEPGLIFSTGGYSDAAGKGSVKEVVIGDDTTSSRLVLYNHSKSGAVWCLDVTTSSSLTFQKNTDCPGGADEYAPIILETPNLGGWWRLGEPSGPTAYDSSGADPLHPGTYSGNDFTHDVTGGLAASNDDGAALFAPTEPTPSKVTVPFVDELWRFSTESYSLEAWVKPGPSNASGLGNRGGVVGTYGALCGNYGEGWGIYLNNGKVVYTRGTNAAVATSPNSVPLDEWTYIAATFTASSNTARLYLDGYLVASDSNPQQTTTCSVSSFTIGVLDFSTPIGCPNCLGYFDGAIDEVAIYQRTLTASEVQSHYDTGTSLASFGAPAPDSAEGALPEVSDSDRSLAVLRAGDNLATTDGDWSNCDTPPCSYSYQWQNSSNGTSWSSASGVGATSSAYVVASSDVGKYLRVVVTAANGSGTAAMSSLATAAVLPAGTPTNQTQPQLSDADHALANAQIGDGLSVSTGSWTNSPTSYSYTWQRADDVGFTVNLAAIGSNSAAYTVQAADLDKFIRVVVQATNALGSSSVFSDSAGPIFANSYALTVSKTGGGTGTVSSSPGGISCGATCSTSFNSGTVVTLTASADVGSTFSGWSGSGCSGSGACIVTMSAARSVSAAFTVPLLPAVALANPSFEGTSGTDAVPVYSSWTQSSVNSGPHQRGGNPATSLSGNTGRFAYDGNSFAYLRANAAGNTNSKAVLTSDAFVPGVATATFYFYAWPSDVSCSRMTVRVLDGAGSPLATPFNAVALSAGWQRKTLDLTTYVGQLIKLELSGGTSCETSGHGVGFDNFTATDPNATTTVANGGFETFTPSCGGLACEPIDFASWTEWEVLNGAHYVLASGHSFGPSPTGGYFTFLRPATSGANDSQSGSYTNLVSDVFTATGNSITFYAKPTDVGSRMVVQVLDAGGTALSTPFNLSGVSSSWTQRTVSMSGLGGQRVRLLLSGRTTVNGSGHGVNFDGVVQAP